ncbi:bromoperoxidase [Ponticoccus alexandrii]|uniref:Bromoperoxidase n=1 Tax=Ponticoccus alexandrii TaxID=1943633 RepID=A0ABX7F7C6_9RHOB|nr:bromoperoxidase [Ponticoccus alexandrii]QRF65499.1 bromoperoxidase [Ponticoccus alexandrii]
MVGQKAKTGKRVALTVIRGGAPPRTTGALRSPVPHRPGPVELAGDMAEIFALSLLRDHPARSLADPHVETRIDRRTRFTLHELLCELRNLPWFDARHMAEAMEPAAQSSGAEGDPGHRRSLHWNGDGQLTLRTLQRCGVALPEDETGASALWREDNAGVAGPCEAVPTGDAPMSAWVAWCAGQSGAGLRVPGLSPEPIVPETPGALADALPRIPAARPFHNAALAALARGALSVSAPSACDLWTGPRLFAVMAEAERHARRMAQEQVARLDRLSRPAVTAARMTLWLAREEREAAPAHAEYRAAAEMLAEHAPGLLHWVSRANAARRGLRRRGLALFLPLAGVRSLEHTPSDTAAHAVVAGALGTLLKAVLWHAPQPLHRIGAAAPAQEVDLLMRDIARARVMSAACLPSEAFADLRLGQAIALSVLREAMERDNRSARLAFRDLDGRALVLQAHPRHFGRGFAELRAEGQPVAWPQESAPPAAHLTQVV